MRAIIAELSGAAKWYWDLRSPNQFTTLIEVGWAITTDDLEEEGLAAAHWSTLGSLVDESFLHRRSSDVC